MARQTKNSKEFSFVVLKQYTSKFVFMLRHGLFNLKPNMLEVGHPKGSFRLFYDTQKNQHYSVNSETFTGN